MSECTTGCGRPTQVSLCSLCLMEMVTDLRQLATGGVERIRVHVIGKDADGEPITKEVVDRRPGLCAELEATLTRQHKLGGPTGAGKAATTPVVFHEAASEVGWVLRNTISTWARDVSELNPHLTLTATTTAEAAAWMANVAGLLAEHPAAGEMYDEITSVVARVRQVVDRQADRIYAGPCLEVIDGQKCPDHVYARADRKTTRCRTCGTEHDVVQRRDWMLRTVGHYERTAAQISRAIPSLFGVEVTEDRIRKWKERGKISVRSHDDKGRPLYRIDDVMRLLAATPESRKAS